MRLSVKGTTIAAALLWGGAILLVGLINLARPAYGTSFLTMIGSVYPRFHSSDKIVTVLISSVDGLFDGAIAGFLFAWLYNLLVDLTSLPTLPGRHA